MGTQFDDLPSWEFTAIETSAGAYSVKATRDGGVVGEAAGADYDALILDLKQWARKIDRDLESNRSGPRGDDGASAS